MTMIALNLIDPPKFNSRLPKTGKAAKDDEQKIAAMADEFNDPNVGQMTAIEVETKADGRYELVFGDRRRRAALKAGWKEINAEVRAPSPDSDRITRNIIENVGRENLTTFEVARSAVQLRDLGHKNQDIGPKFGISSTHVSNLVTAYKENPAPILKDWEAQSPVATIQNLCDVARGQKTDDDKLRKWDELVAEAAEKEAAGQKPGKRGKAKTKGGGAAGSGVNSKRLDHVLTMLSSSKGSPELENPMRNWGKGILDFILSQREHPPAGIPRMPAKAAKGKDADEKDAE